MLCVQDKENQEALTSFQKSGPLSSVNSPKPLTEFQKLCEKVIKLEENVVTLKESDDMKSAKIASLSDTIKSLQCNVNSFEVRLGLSVGDATNPITLKSHVLTPELHTLSKTLHLPDAKRLISVNTSDWKTQLSHYMAINDVIGVGATGALDQVNNIRQLPPQKFKGKMRYPVNIEFHSLVSRSMAVQALAKYGKDRSTTYPIHFCLNNHPMLKHNLSAISSVLRDLQERGDIVWYSTNNLMAVKGLEKVAPMYIFRTSGMKEPTDYRDCATNSLFHNGMDISLEDKSFNSEEFKRIKATIVDQVNRCKAVHPVPVLPSSTSPTPADPCPSRYTNVAHNNETPDLRGESDKQKPSQSKEKPIQGKEKTTPNAWPNDMSNVDFIKTNGKGKRGASSSPKQNTQQHKRSKNDRSNPSQFRKPVEMPTPTSRGENRELKKGALSLSPPNLPSYAHTRSYAVLSPKSGTTFYNSPPQKLSEKTDIMLGVQSNPPSFQHSTSMVARVPNYPPPGFENQILQPNAGWSIKPQQAMNNQSVMYHNQNVNAFLMQIAKAFYK